MKNILFGPVNSRRFGKSLGIDLSPTKKQCNFDCLYCELAPAKTISTYEDLLSTQEIMQALEEGLRLYPDIDVLTITANGEPTLYPYLSELMDEINKIKGSIKTLILSNGSTIANEATQEALMKFDTVKLSLDCATSLCLKRLDRADSSVEIDQIKSGMLAFRSKFQNPLIIEVLMVKNINDKPQEIKALNGYLLELNPSRIDLGTIDRPPAYTVEPLSYEDLYRISLMFDERLPLYIASRKKRDIDPSSYSEIKILDTLKKRPLTQEDIDTLLDSPSLERFKKLYEEGKIHTRQSGGYEFFVVLT